MKVANIKNLARKFAISVGMLKVFNFNSGLNTPENNTSITIINQKNKNILALCGILYTPVNIKNIISISTGSKTNCTGKVIPAKLVAGNTPKKSIKNITSCPLFI